MVLIGSVHQACRGPCRCVRPSPVALLESPAMSYQVLARKWRPKSFGTLIGQEHVVRALTHALATGRLHHAWLFTGTRGVGKTTISRILAKALNCETGITPEPCGVCDACRAIDADRFPDYVEMDAASNRGVDDMAALLDKAVAGMDAWLSSLAVVERLSDWLAVIGLSMAELGWGSVGPWVAWLMATVLVLWLTMQLLPQLKTMPYHRRFSPSQGIEIQFLDAGHR